MALLRLQAAAGLALRLLALSLLPGCAETTRVAVSVPRASAGAGVDEKAIFFAAAGGGAEAGDGRDFQFRRQVLGGLVKGFLDSGRYSIVPVEDEAAFDWSGGSVLEGITVADADGVLVYRQWSARKSGRSFLEAARDLARARGADVLVILLATSASLEERIHHVHSYLDGNAQGEAALLHLSEGAIAGLARERVSVSGRSRYTTTLQVQDHLASRLAESLTRSLLYEKRGERVDLDDPSDGSLRRGIELAKKGDWHGAATAWEEALSSGFHPAAAHYNIAVARRVLGDPERAREHLEAARRLDPGKTRYRRALGEARGGERR